MIYAALLAAGASSRYGVSPPKQQVLVPRVLAALAEKGVPRRAWARRERLASARRRGLTKDRRSEL
jgi:CTP:molybdopterin cytidylyltransferase MocA